MKKGNPNHPRKGSSCRVQPIKSLKDVAKVKAVLTRKQDKCLFTCGINLALRASDLTSLTVDQVKDLGPMDTLEIKERKTGKVRNVVFNGACISAIRELLICRKDGEHLFQGRGGVKASTIYVNSLVKKWTKKANLKGNFGSHSLRKTWATMALREFNVPLPDIMFSLQHSNVSTTMRYLGINPETVSAAFKNEL
jgi:integrase